MISQIKKHKNKNKGQQAAGNTGNGTDNAS